MRETHLVGIPCTDAQYGWKDFYPIIATTAWDAETNQLEQFTIIKVMLYMEHWAFKISIPNGVNSPKTRPKNLCMRHRCYKNISWMMKAKNILKYSKIKLHLNSHLGVNSSFVSFFFLKKLKYIYIYPCLFKREYWYAGLKTILWMS